MECIDLQTGYMLLAFRSLQETDRATALLKVRGIQVAYTVALEEIEEQEGAAYVKQIQQNGQKLYWNYSNQSSSKLCDTAKASLGSALGLANALSGVPCDYLLIYEKEKPHFESHKPAVAQPAVPVN
ncbi:hypothetical protein MKJ04_09555 [Pontibacter sp. E15-1]|uniref:hypothetical protein n=1 Tax=Pontibacter sp. E15-1 TaxID=2919918 RepID=UPI001F4F8C4B|nr:hypothetical protein [Pontibacter sp. E15-1]MCJ8165089.1 hypothetical protein [Pontibacter sp. E15-1]